MGGARHSPRGAAPLASIAADQTRGSQRTQWTPPGLPTSGDSSTCPPGSPPTDAGQAAPSREPSLNPGKHVGRVDLPPNLPEEPQPGQHCCPESRGGSHHPGDPWATESELRAKPCSRADGSPGCSQAAAPPSPTEEHTLYGLCAWAWSGERWRCPHTLLRGRGATQHLQSQVPELSSQTSQDFPFPPQKKKTHRRQETGPLQEPHLDDEVSAPEVGDGPRQPGAAPHEAQEEGALGVGKGLHHLPEPLDQGRRRLHPFVGRHRL